MTDQTLVAPTVHTQRMVPRPDEVWVVPMPVAPGFRDIDAIVLWLLDHGARVHGVSERAVRFETGRGHDARAHVAHLEECIVWTIATGTAEVITRERVGARYVTNPRVLPQQAVTARIEWAFAPPGRDVHAGDILNEGSLTGALRHSESIRAFAQETGRADIAGHRVLQRTVITHVGNWQPVATEQAPST